MAAPRWNPATRGIDAAPAEFCHKVMNQNQDPFKLSLSNFLAAGESNDPLQAPPNFTKWVRESAWARTLYEPELLATADARTTINYDGKQHSVINLCSYNYLGLANHPEVIAAAHEALKTHGLGACGAPILSGMTDLHRELERRVEPGQPALVHALDPGAA